MMVLDEAAKLRTGNAEDDLPLMYGALAHDFGKPATTRTIGGRITSYEHDVKGAVIAEAFLEKLRAPKELTKKVEALVSHHLAPAFTRTALGKPTGSLKIPDARGTAEQLLRSRPWIIRRTTDDASRGGSRASTSRK
jgi:tRNA nucleotidyltransferase (CCA-adding enzyme)